MTLSFCIQCFAITEAATMPTQAIHSARQTLAALELVETQTRKSAAELHATFRAQGSGIGSSENLL